MRLCTPEELAEMRAMLRSVAEWLGQRADLPTVTERPCPRCGKLVGHRCYSVPFVHAGPDGKRCR